MIRNYFKIVWRNLKKEKLFSFINIIGLSISLASVFLMVFHIKNELSYDKGFTKSDKIFRITHNFGQGERHWAATSFPLTDELKKIAPEIVSSIRFRRPYPYQLLSPITKGKESLQIQEKNGFYVDENVINIFDLKFKYGNPKTALTETNSIVLTEKLAHKYFGYENPLGKTIKEGMKNLTLNVSGVVKDFPFQTHLKFDYLISMQTFKDFVPKRGLESRRWAAFYSYVELHNLKSVPTLNSKLKEFRKKYRIKDKDSSSGKYQLQAIEKIHLHSKLEKEMSANSDISYVYIFSFVALFILLLASVNFVNLETVQSLYRIREVGIRKVIGARKKDLIFQFLGQSFSITFISFGGALVLFIFAIPYYNNLTGYYFTIHEIITLSNTFAILGFIFFIAFFAGAYPAFLASKLCLSSTLNGKSKLNSQSFIIRDSLIIIQFGISIFMISSTIIVYLQLNLFHNKDLGFNQEQVLAINLYPEMKKKIKPLLNNLENVEAIKKIAWVDKLPGERFPSYDLIIKNKLEKETDINCRLLSTNSHFLEVLDIKLLKGRNLIQKNINTKKKTTEFIINQATLKATGLQKPLGKIIKINGRKGKIVGIVQDFNFASLHGTVEPLAICNSRLIEDYLILKIQKTNIQQTIESIEKNISIIYPSSIFSYIFLNKQIEKLYQKEDIIAKIINGFALLSILISCLGLYGIAAYITKTRIKEIGIRKTLGATTISIVNLISKNFIKLILIASAIATPITLWVMTNWLQKFAHRITIQWWMLIFTIVIVLFIAFITLSYQSIKAFKTNPIKSLKTE